MKDGAYGYDSYLSPFTWRYGSEEMRGLFSETERRATWRRVWLGLAEAEAAMGLISKGELEGIRKSSGRESVDIGRAHEIEKKIRHDLMAELRVFADQAQEGGGKLHLGATSMDVEDNADAVIFGKALDIVSGRLTGCLEAAAVLVRRHKGTICMGWTHLQPAEPTTLGYRFANYAQDLAMDIKLVGLVRREFVKGKGVKGAVGTSASYKKLLGTAARVKGLEESVMSGLGIGAFEVATQTYPRKLDLLVLSALASVAASCAKFGLDLRVLQSPAFGELSEPIEEAQVGSSAMPFKRNPVTAERMCSLARIASVMPLVAFMNASNSILERTLDDSAARRVAVPEAFLAVDECLAIYDRLLRGIRVYPAMIRRNLERFGAFSGTEAVMMEMVAKGEDRQRAHELIRVKSFEAWEAVMKGEPNPLEGLLSREKGVSSRVPRKRLRALMDPSTHTGLAEEACEEFLEGVVSPILAKGRKAGRSRVEY
ncbi:MAG: adenylosuccinate lyase [Nitrososphaerota archaeon]|nr:adenylosuccinate lyase [Nitrososphaerota archaeon]MDG6978085.1 adenylosuccinate lyase [Nitrososphaerota archaeon]